MPSKETILVTGASGFIGGWITETIHLTGAAQVRAGIRTWISAARLGRFPLDVVLCDVLDKEQVAKAVKGVDIVIHTAVGGREVTVEGTKNMLEAALKEGVKRFVHISTAEVYGDVSGMVDENAALQRTGKEYGDTKIEAEELCWQYHAKGLPVTVIRPGIVYGPFGDDWTVGIARKLASSNWRIFKGYGDGLCNLVYVSDLVSGVLLAAHHENAVGQAFNINGPDDVTWNNYFRRFNAALGLPELQMTDPTTSRLRAAVIDPLRTTIKLAVKHYGKPIKTVYQRFRAAREVMQLVEGSMKTTASLKELSLYNRDARYSGAKAGKSLGYTPAFDLDRGLSLTAAWLKQLSIIQTTPMDVKERL